MIDTNELQELEAGVGLALRTGDLSHLRLIGHGEMTMALGWPADQPKFVCKRLPPFSSARAASAYEAVVTRYIDELRRRGVRTVDTDVRWLDRTGGGVIGYLVQPALAPETLGPDVLRRSTPSSDHPLVRSVVDKVAAATGNGVGIDAQLSNWAWVHEEPWQLDVSTPMMMDSAGQPALDMGPFLAKLPAVSRPVVRREMVKLMRRWMSTRGSMVDLAANVIKENLEDWIDPVLECINDYVEKPVTYQEALSVYKADRRMFPFLLALVHVNQYWQERIRRRPFEFLLPDSTTYQR
jgi:hypothetical protein